MIEYEIKLSCPDCPNSKTINITSHSPILWLGYMERHFRDEDHKMTSEFTIKEDIKT